MPHAWTKNPHVVALDHARRHIAREDGDSLAVCVQHGCDVACFSRVRRPLPQRQACIVGLAAITSEVYSHNMGMRRASQQPLQTLPALFTKISTCMTHPRASVSQQNASGRVFGLLCPATHLPELIGKAVHQCLNLGYVLQVQCHCVYPDLHRARLYSVIYIAWQTPAAQAVLHVNACGVLQHRPRAVAAALPSGSRAYPTVLPQGSNWTSPQQNG